MTKVTRNIITIKIIIFEFVVLGRLQTRHGFDWIGFGLGEMTGTPFFKWKLFRSVDAVYFKL